MSIKLYLIVLLFSKVQTLQLPPQVSERQLYDARFRTFLDLIKKLSEFFDVTSVFPKLGHEELSKKIMGCVAGSMETKIPDKIPPNVIDKLKHTNRKSETIATEEKDMSTSQLVHLHGYKAETHSVQTRDGYVLEIFKIIPNDSSPRKKKSLVLLHHGLMGSSDDWVLLGPEKALPYMLADAGYDVWLANARGNKYSKFHAGLSVDSAEFWDFSFHEIGYYDLPATIDYIKSNSERDVNINFVGHSMGGTALFVLLSSLPEYHKVVKTAILLAPLAFMSKIRGPLALLAEFYKKNGRKSLDFLGDTEFMPIQSFPRQFIEKYCINSVEVCLNPFLFIANGGKTISSAGVLDLVLGHVPAGSSAKTIRHYIQLINSGQFTEYDYGGNDNVKRHGSVIPPSYNLSNIMLPIVLYSSRDDWLCTRPNMLALLQNLPNVVIHHTLTRTDFSHTDFMWGQNVSNLVFHPIKEILENVN